MTKETTTELLLGVRVGFIDGIPPHVVVDKVRTILRSAFDDATVSILEKTQRTRYTAGRPPAKKKRR